VNFNNEICDKDETTADKFDKFSIYSITGINGASLDSSQNKNSICDELSTNAINYSNEGWLNLKVLFDIVNKLENKACIDAWPCIDEQFVNLVNISLATAKFPDE